MTNSWPLILFIVVSIIQIGVPLQMVISNESAITSGKAYRFKTIPVDPNDPFRGKYIRLRFEANRFVTLDSVEWQRGEIVYVAVGEDEQGFATIRGISRTPYSSQDYLRAEVDAIRRDDKTTVVIQYPFNRFYMEESKAPEAERIYREAQIDPQTDTYALISIRNGKGTITDVLIDGTSIREMVGRQ